MEKYKTFNGIAAVQDEQTREVVGIVNNLFGDDIGKIKNGNVNWSYLKGIRDGDSDFLRAVAQSTYWRSKRCDITGLVYMGARYYLRLVGNS